MITTGEYEVDFGRDVSACSYQATLNSTPGEVEAEPRTTVADGVFVTTFNSSGTAAARGFDLAVFC